MTTGNSPEKKIRAGAVSATVWSNEGTSKTGEKVEYKTISLERNYKDKEGNWKSTNSFRVNDLPKAKLVLDKAYEYLILKEGDTAVAMQSTQSVQSDEEEIF